MFKLNGDIYQNGKKVFVERFKARLKQNKNWDVEIVWEENTEKNMEKDESAFSVRFHMVCTLTLSNDAIEDFGVEGHGVEATWCDEILNKKERELVKKFSLNQKE